MRCIIAGTLFSLFFCTQALAQVNDPQHLLDSLIERGKLELPDTSKALWYTDMAMAYFFLETDSVLPYAEKGLTFIKSINYTKGIGWSLVPMGRMAARS
ncbi:MAG: hypothetical protein AAFQ37_10975, partial [Bacteroidota bacterium]